MDDSPIISEYINNKIYIKISKLHAIYQKAINEGFLKDISLILATQLLYRSSLSTVSYIIKYEPYESVIKQTQISEKLFNVYLSGILM